MPWESVGAALWLLFWVAVILALACFATRRIAAGGGMGFGPAAAGGRLSLLARLPLGRDQSLVVVRVDQRCLVLGISPGGITLLRELPPEETPRWTAPPEGSPPMDFRALLRSKGREKEGR